MPDTHRTLFLPILVGAFALAGTVAFSPAMADDDELTFEQSIIHSLLGGAAGRPDIDYRERSPLVIPPSRDLPPPDQGTALQSNAAWPQDPDRRRRTRSDSGPWGADGAAKREARPLSPDQLRRGARGGAGGGQGPVVTPGDAQAGRPLTPAELGERRGLLGLMGRAVGSEPPAQFTSEPSRARLTQPPVGYQTPSQAQPYAPPKSAGWLPLRDIFDRTTPSSDR